MELALGAMVGLAPKLGDLLKQEYVVQKGLKPDIESLFRELVTINAALVDASRVPLDQLSEVEKHWGREVWELSYDMEDAIDGFILRVADGGKSAATTSDAKVFKKILGKATAAIKKFKDRRQIADKVQDIKKLSNELAELRAKYTVRGAGAHLAATTGIDPRVLNLYKKESDLVGIKESRDKVIRMLSIPSNDDAPAPSDQDLKIVSIVGVGGLGKTTLAKTVHDMLKKQFDCFAFISVGRTPNLTKTFEKFLMELDKKYKQVDMTRWDIEQFGNELHEFLEQKRYFIVVDDIWDVGSWEVIRYAFKDNNCGSRIIMTTRNFEVVTRVEEVYRLKPLSDGNSKKLFYKRIQSQRGESLDGVSSELSSKIIDRCGGIPLAIIAIASLLVERPREDWSKVCDSISFGNGDNTMKILSYSYYDLPSYLKPCLLILSLYSEDSIFDTKCIIWRWIAEGFVHLEREEVSSLFEVGDRYFHELVNRSMIQPIDEKYVKFKQQFIVHDIVFDLIRKLSSIENFVTILDSEKQQASPNSLRREKKTSVFGSDSMVRRLVVRNQHVQRFPEDTMDRPEVLRSLNIVDSKIEIMAPLDSFKVCRVLYIRCRYNPISLKHLGRLLHLKYLEISKTPIDELPKEIGNLKSLQTLLLYKNTRLDELSPVVYSLTQLMCLIAVGFKRLPADRIGYLTSLEELRLKSIDDRSAMEDLVVELGKLTRLRVVSINFSVELEESLQKSLVQSLCNLQELKELKLSSIGLSQQGATVWEDWEVSRQLRRLRIDGIIFSRWPGRINRSHLPCLCFLSLTVYVVEVQDLDNLARLPELNYLHLYGVSWPPWYAVGTDGFKNLRHCDVSTTLKFHMGAMPRLEVLVFVVFAGYWSWEKHGLPLERFPTKDIIKDFDLGLDNLILLEQVAIIVDCSGATTAEVEELEPMVKRAVQNHPNHPTIGMDRVCEENILSEEHKVALHQKHIEKHFNVLEWKDDPDASFIVDLQSYRNLEKAIISIDCVGANMHEVEKVEAALKHAADVHHNHPTIQLIRTNTDEMSSSKDPHTERHFELQGRVLKWKDVPDAFSIRVLQSRPHLEKAVISIDCAGASKCEVERVEAAFRNAAEVHHNHPTIQLVRRNTDEIELITLIAERFERFPTDKMGNLISLVELRLESVVGRSATEDLVVELGKQTRLRFLTITFSEELEDSLQKALVQSLCNLQELRELELYFTGVSQQGATVWEEDWEAPRQLQWLLIAGIIFSRLPRWINPSRLPHLWYFCLVTLVTCPVEVQDLDNLARLPELSYLDLYSLSWPPVYTIGRGGFRNLRSCSLNTTLKFHKGDMPRLEELQFEVYAGYWSWEKNGVSVEQFPTKDVTEDLDMGLDNLLSLKQVTVTVNCSGATAAEVQEVEAMVTRAVENHPNRPTIQMDRVCEGNILSDERKVALLQQQIKEHFGVLEWKDKHDASFISKLRRYRRLEKAVISIDCAGASMCEVEKVEAALKQAAVVHHNHPTIQLIRDNSDKMLSSSEHPDTELDDDHDDSLDNLLCKLHLRN